MAFSMRSGLPYIPASFSHLARQNMGGKLTTRSVERMVQKYRPVEGISPHSFRHGLGMRAVSAGIHPRHIQKILGHKNITSSQIYMDTVDKEVREAYRKIGQTQPA